MGISYLDTTPAVQPIMDTVVPVPFQELMALGETLGKRSRAAKQDLRKVQAAFMGQKYHPYHEKEFKEKAEYYQQKFTAISDEASAGNWYQFEDRIEDITMKLAQDISYGDLYKMTKFYNQEAAYAEEDAKLKVKKGNEKYYNSYFSNRSKLTRENKMFFDGKGIDWSQYGDQENFTGGRDAEGNIKVPPAIGHDSFLNEQMYLNDELWGNLTKDEEETIDIEREYAMKHSIGGIFSKKINEIALSNVMSAANPESIQIQRSINTQNLSPERRIDEANQFVENTFYNINSQGEREITKQGQELLDMIENGDPIMDQLSQAYRTALTGHSYKNLEIGIDLKWKPQGSGYALSQATLAQETPGQVFKYGPDGFKNEEDFKVAYSEAKEFLDWQTKELNSYLGKEKAGLNYNNLLTDGKIDEKKLKDNDIDKTLFNVYYKPYEASKKQAKELEDVNKEVDKAMEEAYGTEPAYIAMKEWEAQDFVPYSMLDEFDDIVREVTDVYRISGWGKTPFAKGSFTNEDWDRIEQIVLPVSLSEQLHGVPATDIYQRFDEKMAMLKKGQYYSKNKWTELWVQASKTRGDLSEMLDPFPNTDKLIDDIQRYRDAQMKEKTQGLSSPFPFETRVYKGKLALLGETRDKNIKDKILEGRANLYGNTLSVPVNAAEIKNRMKGDEVEMKVNVGSESQGLLPFPIEGPRIGINVSVRFPNKEFISFTVPASKDYTYQKAIATNNPSLLSEMIGIDYLNVKGDVIALPKGYGQLLKNWQGKGVLAWRDPNGKEVAITDFAIFGEALNAIWQVLNKGE